MDIVYIGSIAVISSSIVFSIWVWRVLNCVWITPRKLEKKFKDQGILGTPYKFSFEAYKEYHENEAKSKPLNLNDDDILTRIIKVDSKIIKQAGKFIYGWYGTTPQLMVLEPELIKEITLKNHHFLTVPLNPLAKLFMNGISSLNGEEWSIHRKIIAPAFHIEKVKLMIPAFYISISEMLNKWEEIVSSKGSAEIDVWPHLRRFTSDVISRIAFGRNYEEGKEIFELQKEQAQYFLKAVVSPYIPGWRFFPSKTNRRIKEISGIIHNKMRCIVEARLKELKAGEARRNDFLGLLLESYSKDDIDEHGSKLTIQDVIEECKLLHISGQETTSVLLVWTMIILGRHPEWQNRAREEVFQLFGKHQIPDHSTLNQLKIMTMILYEVLRLYTPTSGMQRRTTEETKFGDFIIPKGVILLLPALVVHHDTELWGDDAYQFKPERFAEGISNATKRQFSFFSFGWGPRICPGQNLALTEVKMTISMILQRFSFEISPSYSHHPYQSPLTVQPKYGAQLIFHKL